MTKQVINVGSAANDGTGDTLRAAAQKVNSNFTELYNYVPVFATANSAATVAQVAYNQANTGTTLAQSAYNQANTGTTLAQAAYNYANTIVSDTQVDPYARGSANAAFLAANNGTTLAQNAYNQANTGTLLAQAAYNSSNTVTGELSFSGSTLLLSDTTAETLLSISPQPDGWAFLQLPNDNTANTNDTRLHNDAGNVEIGAGDFSNGGDSYTWVFGTNGSLKFPDNTLQYTAYFGYGTDNTARTTASTANVVSQLAFNQANTGTTLAQNAYNQANAAFDKANTVSGGSSNTLTDGTETLTLSANTLTYTGYNLELVNSSNCAISFPGEKVEIRSTSSGEEFNPGQATWQFQPSGTVACPAETSFNSSLGTISMGTTDASLQSLKGAFIECYDTSADDAWFNITARDPSGHTASIYGGANTADNLLYVNIETYDGGAVYGGNSWKFFSSGITKFPIAGAPTTSVGQSGDLVGMVAMTATHIYFCVLNYDGNSDIWKRIAWPSETW